MCIGDVVYVQEHMKDLVSRDAGLKNYHYTENTYSSCMAIVISIDKTCNCIEMKYCSLGTTIVVSSRNVLKATMLQKLHYRYISTIYLFLTVEMYT